MSTTYRSSRKSLSNPRFGSRFDSLTGATAALVMLLILGVTLSGFFLSAWILMLILGALHHSAFEAVPAIGYWVSLLIVVAIGFLKGLIK